MLMLKPMRPPEPWAAFFDEVDAGLSAPVELHCFGGFVATHLYGVGRTTNDVDFVSLVPNIRQELIEAAGQGSPLHRRYRVYLDGVTVATPPENYNERLLPLFPGVWEKLKLFALEPHDLALAKLDRNIERDRDDVVQLARAGHLYKTVLEERYYQELRPYLAHEERHDLTLRLWMDLCWPEEEVERSGAG